MFFSLSLSEMMLKVGFNKHYLVIAMLFCVLLAKAQTPPSFTSTPVTNGTYGTAYLYSITTEDAESNARIIAYSGTLPNGVAFNDGGDGTASIAGTANETGSFPIVLTVTDQIDGTQNTQSFTITIAKASATVTLSNLTTIYNGSPQSITAITSPAGLTVDITYNGLTSVPTDANSYAVVATINDSNYQGTNSDVFAISKATPTVAWTNPTDIIYGTVLSTVQLNASSSVAGLFNYSPATGTTLNAGAGQTLSVDFTPTDAANYNSVTNTHATITVNKATPTITWANPADITYATALSTTQLNATASVAGTFTYTPVAGTVMSAGVGQTLSVDFNPTDAANYNFVNNTHATITVNKATPTITWANPATITYGTALSTTQLNATASVAGTFTYTPAAGTVMNAGTNQTLSVNFVPTDGTNYNAVNNTQAQITVSKATPTITWANPATITYGTALSTTQLNATASVAGTFTYTPAAGTVMNAGTNQILSVNFVPTDGTNYNAVNNTQAQITVNKATPTVTWANPATITYGTALSTTQLNATASVAGSFSYAPGAGTILNAGAGQALSVNFTPTDASNYNAVPGTQVSINVNKATPTITWSNPAAITYGTVLSTTQLNSTAGVGGTFTYTPAAGTVLTTGANQTLSVNFAPSDAANYNPVSNTQVLITVNKATPVITWSNPTAITYGTALSATQLNASANVAGAFTYTPSTGTILNAGAAQTLSVNFVPTDAINYNSVNNTQALITVNKATPIITWSNPTSITYGTALSSTQLNASANVGGTFTYTPSAGTVLNAGAGQTLSVNFTPTNASNYNSVNNTQALITVNKATPTVTWANPASIIYGTVLSGTQLNATASVAGTFTYTPAAGITLNAGANQTLSVNFTPTDAANYNAVSNTQVQITVNKATPTVTWTTPAAIIYGTALSATQLNATASTAGTFTYTPASGTILSVGTNQTLSVNFSPTDAANYNAVNNTQVLITVNKATPTITWATPASINYGTALSATQLNATSSVAGTFIYTPTTGTLLNAGANQTLSVDFTPTDAANYNAVNGTQRLITVNKIIPVITWATPAAITYGTALSATQLNATSSVPGTFTYTPASGVVLNAGASQTLSVNFTPTDAVNYSTVNNTQRLITINKATPIISWATPAPIKVNVALSSTQLNASTSVAGTFTYTPASGTSYGAEGNYTLSVNFTPTDATNYSSVNNTQVSLTVSSKDNPVITWVNPSAITYGTLLSSTQLNASASVPGTYTYTPTSGALLNAGTNQNLTINFVPTDAVNYNSVSKTVLITVNKAIITATASNASRVYGAANPSFIIGYSGFVNSETSSVIDTPPTATCSAIASSTAGNTFSIVPSGGVDNNYSFNYVNGILTITKASLIAKADDKSRSYGLANPTFTIGYTGFVNGDNSGNITPPTVGTTATSASNVGNYPITLSGGTSTNYTFTLQSGTLAINISPLTVKANDLSKTYGQVNPALTLSYNGFLNGDTPASITLPTVSTTASTTSPAGSYLISISGGSALNYGLILQTGTLTINKAPLTITADNQSKNYGQTNPALTVSYSGFVNGETSASITAPGINTAANAASAAGTYSIVLTGGVAANYNLTLQNGTLTINKASITFNLDNKSRFYGSANPPFTYSYSGLMNGDDESMIDARPLISTIATISSPAGTYSIDASGGSDNNYSISYVAGSLTIDKAMLTLTVDNQSKPYGSTNPSLTYSYAGFVNGENESTIDTPPTLSTTATVASPTGATYPITASAASDNNYTISYVDGTLTINKAILTLTVYNKSKTYASINPAFTFAYSGFVNGETESVIDTPPTVSTIASVSSSAGTYPINASGAFDDNYSFNYVTGILTVDKALLTVTIADKSRAYGSVNPAFTFAYSGFVNGEPESVIDTPPTVSTTANVSSSAGIYPITATGADDNNYTFSTVEGTLTITKIVLAVKANNITQTYGTTPSLTLSYTTTDFVNGETSAVIDNPPTLTTTATSLSPVGSYPITVAGGSDNNYTFSPYTSGTLTINKAMLTVTANNANRLFNTANPPLTVTYSGFVNNETVAVINALPIATTSAVVTSPGGTYPITVSAGADDAYDFIYINGTLTVIVNNPPVLKNFQVSVNEDTPLTFTYEMFSQNITDDPGSQITFVKILSLPTNGTLFLKGVKAIAGDEIVIINNTLSDFTYQPNADYNGTDSFNWNSSDGTFIANNQATVSIKINSINDAPVLSNIESEPIKYSLGDKGVAITQKLSVSDADNNFIHSAKITIAQNYSTGDNLAAGISMSTKIVAAFNTTSGELTLKGKDTKSSYEAALSGILFSSAVTGAATISNKNITIVVNDSTSNSNIVSRIIEITEVFPELDIVNAFTPNNDGVNDQWDFVNLQNYSGVKITVVNQEGIEVFKCTTNTCAWDGKLNGSELPSGIYLYTIDLNNGKRKYQGTVSILK